MDVETRSRLVRIAITVGGMLAFMGFIVVGLWLSDDGSAKRRMERLGEVHTSFRTKPVDPAEVWITKSETEIRKLEERNRELEERIKMLERRIKSDDRKLSSEPPRTPPGNTSPSDAFLQALEKVRHRSGILLEPTGIPKPPKQRQT
ncbi:MAG: hypothetical protein D6775_14745, partial [Caldilineae bacterium]